MPVTCDQQRAKWRIIERSGRVAVTSDGNPLDGGGHEDQGACIMQARTINANIVRSKDDEKQSIANSLMDKEV